MEKIYIQFVIVEFYNCAAFVYKMTSKRKITINRVCAFFKRTEGFDESRDNMQLIDEPTDYSMDMVRKKKE